MMARLLIIFVVFLFSGCAFSQKVDNFKMDNHIIILDSYKDQGKVKFFDQEKVIYPSFISNKYITLGEGLLYRAMYDDLYGLDIPPGKKARVYIKSNDDALFQDIKEILKRFNKFTVAYNKSMVDFTIEVNKKQKNFVDISLKSNGAIITEHKKIDILKELEAVNNTDYELIKIGWRSYEIKKTSILKNKHNLASKNNISFNDALKYCGDNEQKAILPKLYIFEFARRKGILKPPNGASKEYVSSYLQENVRPEDTLPISGQDFVIFDWKKNEYKIYNRSRKNDDINFRNVEFRCMRFIK